jgi:hypothetical protein
MVRRLSCCFRSTGGGRSERGFCCEMCEIYYYARIFFIFENSQMSKKLDDSLTLPTACAPARVCARSTSSYATP